MAQHGTAKMMEEQESPKGENTAQPEAEAVIEPVRGRGRRRNRAAGTDVSVNMDELRELIQVIRENEFTEFELEREGFRVRFRRGAEAYETGASDVNPSREFSGSAQGGTLSAGASKVISGPAHPGARAETSAAEDPDLHIVPSPIVGTFYRAASPTADSFVEIGRRVEQDKTVLCIIEAMKLMNEILADASGVVSEIYVENGQAVEYGQPLFGIKVQ